ncbi:unnamed protein product [Chondrus crispus]|uniref:F-box protein n=1 Tax=Chondrus crispus TaxID=2769 RepID=R7Q8B7_CHOCR|nr:unnamed protein product [Chondrus crispus]CDF34279.1 unnamed protein product [Chondrus crispus]|eukprot:XP_005714098.1 unnamed protein product [Chondrus crispus]
MSSAHSPSRDPVVLFTLRFWPFSSNPPSSTPSPDSDSPDAPKKPKPWLPKNMFSSWASDNAHHFSVCPDSIPLPSEASVLVFNVFRQNRNRSSGLIPVISVDPFRPYALLTVSIDSQKLCRFGEIVKPSNSLRRLLGHVVDLVPPLSETSTSLAPSRDPCGFVGCGGACRPVPPEGLREAFHMENVFRQVTRDSSSHNRTDASSPKSVSPSSLGPAPLPGRTRCAGWLNLPEEVLHLVVLHLRPKDCIALSNVNEELHDFMKPFVPGLLLRLFPHQVDSLARMISMEERRPASVSMSMLHRFDVPRLPNVCVVADMTDGTLMRLAQMPQLEAPRGGLFCDEPGLGKTITALSLVLKTLGQMPRPPDGRVMETVPRRYGEGDVSIYREVAVGRYCAYGEESAVPNQSRRGRLFPFSDVDKRRSSNRRVRRPDFHNPAVGQGSVPFISDRESEVVYLSRGSLIVVPPVLTWHWEEQISMHVREGGLRVLHVKRVRDLPESAEELATDYDVVMTSFNVIAELSNSIRATAPLLMRVRFLRIIVDEGHKLSGGSLSLFAHACERLRAERRWVMTGTPTPSTARCDVDHLYHLLRFIRDEEYGLDKKAWLVGIREPFSQYYPQALKRLQPVLRRVMIRADKSMLTSRCHISNSILDFTKGTAADYNWLVSLTRRNLLTADWFSETHKESLLNKNNLGEAQLAIRNLRMACCYGGTKDAMFDASEVIDTLNELYEKYMEKAHIHPNDRFDCPSTDWPLLTRDGVSGEKEMELQRSLYKRADMWDELAGFSHDFLRLTRHYKNPKDGVRFRTRIYSGILNDIGRSFLEREAHCARCHVFTSIPMVTPCGHLLCEECVALDKEKCTALHCGVAYDLDNKENVPEDLIELQPAAYSPDDFKAKWDTNWGPKMAHLVDRLRNLPREETWFPGESEPRQMRPKVIIHSTITDHLKFVAVTLKECEDLKYSYIEMFKNTREMDPNLKMIKSASEFARQSVRMFAEDEERNILLLSSKHGSVGLDLSFVQYIFLLEPVWDASMELQIISRAHRIGSKRDIYVERLVMKGSVEHELLQDLDSETQIGLEKFGGARSHEDLSRVRSILRNLKPVCAPAMKVQVNGRILPKKRQSCGDEVEVAENENSRSVRFRVTENY